jgi:hypothetical protein
MPDRLTTGEGETSPPFLIVYGRDHCPFCGWIVQRLRKKHKVVFLEVGTKVPASWLLHNYPAFQSGVALDSLNLPIVTLPDGTLIGGYLEALEWLERPRS